jgi:hypothetical protein
MPIDPAAIRLGASFSNGEFGQKWLVWQVVDIQQQDQLANNDLIRYRVVVGTGRRKYFVSTRAEFAAQVKYEVQLVENSWQRID